MGTKHEYILLYIRNGAAKAAPLLKKFKSVMGNQF